MKRGLPQALGVVGYITLVATFISSANKLLPGPDNSFFGPILFLLLFSTSALVCGLIVFYKPYKLFMDGKKKDALQTVVFTAVWLFVILLTILTGILVFR